VTSKDKEASLQEFEIALANDLRGPRVDRTLEVNVRKAAQANRAYARSLGWGRNLRRVLQSIDLRRQSFPQAVAAWQRAHGLRADGVIGPGTWARMQQSGARRITEREVDVPREYDVLLTKGQVGKAFAALLKLIKAPDDVISAIASSKTFQDRAKAIEAKYVARDDLAPDETVEDGTITTGKRANKPVLAVSVDPGFSAFATVGSIDSMVNQDTIIMQLPDSPSTAEFVTQIALGTARAHQWVTRKNRSDEANVNILNALKRDMMALQDADIIVRQAYAGKELKGQTRPPAMEGLPDNFQRAMYGSQFLHTGLEHHVLNEFATQEIIRKKLRRSEITAFKVAADNLKIDARPLADYLVDPGPLFVTTAGGSPVPLDSKYMEQRAVLQVIQARWKTLGDLAKAEIGVVTEMLEDHQNAFFQGVIRYPKSKST
jgi:peptidoglycan hydrolase-like protein with peptidoglycan-binding domain